MVHDTETLKLNIGGRQVVTTMMRDRRNTELKWLREIPHPDDGKKLSESGYIYQNV